MNRKGFFVSLTALIILLILISLVLLDQTVGKERADTTWDESRKELVSELVYDLENSMIPNTISKATKNSLVANSKSTGTTPLSEIIIDVENNLSELSNNIKELFTIPIDTLNINIVNFDIIQTDAFNLRVIASISYEIKSNNDKWSNTVSYELPLSVYGVTHPHPDFSFAGPITPEFWNDHWEECLLKDLISGKSCDPNHGICPVLLEWCENTGSPIVIAPDPPIVP